MSELNGGLEQRPPALKSKRHSEFLPHEVVDFCAGDLLRGLE
ncbi:MAG TPA: hypothetical protein VMX38_07060 [Verrucomicrobiae bacterium]|nr:hypothetical protein [Verrucomicrobiae bacterium]